MAGLACARALADAGLRPVVFDKGRGIGGRLATRRIEGGLQFDHGAQFVTASGPAFAAVLEGMKASGTAAPWADGANEDRFVGLPGMTGLAKHVGKGLDIRQNTEIISVLRVEGQWMLQIGAENLPFDHVVLTAPAPQSLRLLGPKNELSRALATVEMAPCLTLMAAFASSAAVRGLIRREDERPLAWIALDSSKPGRSVPNAWIAQTGPDWSSRHLELSMEEATEQLLPMLCDYLALDRASVIYSATHRWRYARATRALGKPFLQDATGTLHVGGDWCIGDRVEDAWTSGHAIANDIQQRA